MTTPENTGNELAPFGEDITWKMKERLAARSAQAARVAKRTFRFVTFSIATTIALVALGLGGYVWYKQYTQGNFYNQRMTDERTCKVRVGGGEMTGRRYYTYRYTDILGVRLISKDDIEERTDLNVSGAGYTVMSYDSDFKPTVINVPKGEVGIQPLPRAEAYAIFTDGKMGSATYHELCRNLNPSHPFATTD